MSAPGSGSSSQDLTGTTAAVAAQPLPDDKSCLACGRKFPRSNSVHALQCNLCMLWAHKECTHLNDESYKHFAALSKQGNSCWMCSSCRQIGRRLAAGFENNSRRIATVEAGLETIKAEVTDMKTEVANVKDDIGTAINRISSLEDRPAQQTTVGTSALDILSELHNIKAREKNIIFHGLPAAPVALASAVARKEFDITLLMDVAGVIGVSIDRGSDVKFVRRLGRNGDNENKPLLVGLRSMEKKDEVMMAAKWLAGTRFDGISISHDLSQLQRERETMLKNIAERKNEDNRLLPPNEQQNVTWKVVGRPDERQVRPIPNFPDGRRQHERRQQQPQQQQQHRQHLQQQHIVSDTQQGYRPTAAALPHTLPGGAQHRHTDLAGEQSAGRAAALRLASSLRDTHLMPSPAGIQHPRQQQLQITLEPPAQYGDRNAATANWVNNNTRGALNALPPTSLMEDNVPETLLPPNLQPMAASTTAASLARATAAATAAAAPTTSTSTSALGNCEPQGNTNKLQTSKRKRSLTLGNRRKSLRQSESDDNNGGGPPPPASGVGQRIVAGLAAAPAGRPPAAPHQQPTAMEEAAGPLIGLGLPPPPHINPNN